MIDPTCRLPKVGLLLTYEITRPRDLDQPAHQQQSSPNSQKFFNHALPNTVRVDSPCQFGDAEMQQRAQAANLRVAENRYR